MKIIIILFLLLCSSSYAGLFQVKTAPIPLILGIGNAEIGYGFGNIAVIAGFQNGELEISDDFSSRAIMNIKELHFGIDYFFIGGLYLGAATSRVDLIYKEESKLSFQGSRSGEANASGIILSAGYRWQKESTFLELGIEWVNYNFEKEKIIIENGNSSQSEEVDIPSSITGVGLDFNIGWAF